MKPTVVWEGPIDGETYRLVSRGPTCSHVENRRVDAMENHAWVPEGDEDTRTEVVNRALHRTRQRSGGAFPPGLQ